MKEVFLPCKMEQPEYTPVVVVGTVGLGALTVRPHWSEENPFQTIGFFMFQTGSCTITTIDPSHAVHSCSFCSSTQSVYYSNLDVEGAQAEIAIYTLAFSPLAETMIAKLTVQVDDHCEDPFELGRHVRVFTVDDDHVLVSLGYVFSGTKNYLCELSSSRVYSSADPVFSNLTVSGMVTSDELSVFALLHCYDGTHLLEDELEAQARKGECATIAVMERGDFVSSVKQKGRLAARYHRFACGLQCELLPDASPESIAYLTNDGRRSKVVHFSMKSGSRREVVIPTLYDRIVKTGSKIYTLKATSHSIRINDLNGGAVYHVPLYRGQVKGIAGTHVVIESYTQSDCGIYEFQTHVIDMVSRKESVYPMRGKPFGDKVIVFY